MAVDEKFQKNLNHDESSSHPSVSTNINSNFDDEVCRCAERVPKIKTVPWNSSHQGCVCSPENNIQPLRCLCYPRGPVCVPIPPFRSIIEVRENIKNCKMPPIQSRKDSATQDDTEKLNDVNSNKFHFQDIPENDQHSRIYETESFKMPEIQPQVPRRNFASKLLENIQEAPQRIDIYYFDHGNSAYFRTTDLTPVLRTEKCSEIIDYGATKFWAEIFGTIHLGVSFITAFFLQLLKFIISSIIRTLIIGTIQLISDYFIKPILSIIFNGIIQPFLILFYNIATSFRDLCEPIAEAIGFFLREFSHLFRSIRLVEISKRDRNFAPLPT